MELLIKCEHCNGKGTEDKRDYNLVDKTTVIENIPCTQCHGSGTQIKKGHYLSYDLIHTKWEMDCNWKILKHQYSIPTYYFYNTTKECEECNGNGYIEDKIIDGNRTMIKQNKCTKCHGEGIIHTKTTKQIYNDIFENYLRNKELRNEIIDALRNKVWEDEKYNQYTEAHPNGYWEVCIRCSRYFDSIENLNACQACVNESMCPENGCCFSPVDDKAREWFKTKGYKKCIGYSDKYNHWKNI